MLCEKILGKLKDFDLTGKTVEYVDVEWHEAFKKIHRKTTDNGREVGIRLDDSVLTRGLFQDDGDRSKYTTLRSDRGISEAGAREICGKSLLRDWKPPCTAFLGRSGKYIYYDL